MATVYELNCNCGEKYLGFTKNLHQREVKHRSNLRCGSNSKLYKHLRACKMNPNDIILNAIYNFVDNDTAHSKEKKCIQQTNCLNSVKYKYKNTRWNQWYNKNKEHRRAYNRQRTNCPTCNKEMSIRSLARHMKNLH